MGRLSFALWLQRRAKARLVVAGGSRMLGASAQGILSRVFWFLGTSTYAAPEASFWRWFCANENALFELEANCSALLRELRYELESVHLDLSFEVGGKDDGRRELVISASGNPAAFPAVERLVSAAPELPRWKWIRFRPRRTPLRPVTFADITVVPRDVSFQLVHDGERVGIFLFIKGYSSQQEVIYGQIGQMMLDQALGEYVLATRVSFVELQGCSARMFSKSIPLEKLGRKFDAFCAAAC